VRYFLCAALALMLLLIHPLGTRADEGDAVIGRWITEKKDSGVEVVPCEGRYCVKIVWLKEPINEDGTEKTDANNPDGALKNRKIIGLTIAKNFEYAGDNKWKEGKIYDPDNGKTYSCNMALEKKDRLKIRGFIGFSLLGRTTYWTRMGNGELFDKKQ